MKKIVSHLWYDTQAKEAAAFYTSVFPDSKITNASVIHDTPSGDCDILSFDIMGTPFMAISAGPYFTFNPSLSFMVNFDPSKDTNAASRINEVWEKLAEGGKVLMELGEYPFSKRYGWIQDKYGLSWQLILTNPEGEERPQVLPSLLFVGDVCGKAEEATDFYLSIFKNSKRGTIAKHGTENPAEKEENVMFTDFRLRESWFVAMDSSQNHKFSFTEAVSFIVRCDNQEEIDYLWEKLSAVPESEQCGWLKDTYGVSWQITPSVMDEYMRGTPEQVERVTKAFLQMKKFNLAALEKAYRGEA